MKAMITSHLEYLQTWDEVDTLAASIKPKKAELDEVYAFFFSLLEDERTMPRRLGIVALMSLRKLYPDKRTELLDAIAAADSEEYYISMAVAWALSSFYIDDRTTEAWFDKISPETRKRAEQKIRDSRRSLFSSLSRSFLVWITRFMLSSTVSFLNMELSWGR